MSAPWPDRAPQRDRPVSDARERVVAQGDAVGEAATGDADGADEPARAAAPGAATAGRAGVHRAPMAGPGGPTPVPWPEIVAHRERLLRLAVRRCPTREDAEDVVHDAMLRCATFDHLDPDRLGQFLTAVTIRLCADVYRATDRGARAVRALHLEEVPTPEDVACAAADAAELRTLLSTLPERQRDVLVDRASGFSVSQISKRHALTYKAAESALSRARSAMRLAMASGLALVGAVVAGIRRRPVGAVALPVAAISLVAAVHHMPSRPVAPPEAYAAPAGIGDGPAGLERRPVVRLPAPTVASAHPAAPAATARRGRVAVPRPPKPKPREIANVDHPLVKGRVTQEGTLVDDAKRCLTADHYSVDFDVDPWRDPPRVAANPHCHPSTPRRSP